MKKFLIIFIILSFVNSDGYSQSDADKVRQELIPMLGQNSFGTDFWFAIPSVFEFNDNEKFYISITALKETAITIECKKNNYTYSDIISENSSKTISLPLDKFEFYNKNNSSIVEEASINLKSNLPVSINIFNYNLGIMDANIILPTNSYGKEFVIHSDFNFNFTNIDKTVNTIPVYISIVSPYDNNKVKLDLASYNNNLKVKFENGDSLLAGESAEFTLNKGDLLLLCASDSLGDISGSKVVSSKPINIQFSHKYSKRKLQNSYAGSLSSSILPLELWGNSYAIPIYSALNEFPTLRILAEEDKTNIYRNGEYWATINNSFTNEIFESPIWTGDKTLDDNLLTILTSDKPISIMLLSDYNKEDKKNGFYISKNATVLPSIERGGKYASFTVQNNNNYKYSDTSIINKLELQFELDNNEIPNDIKLTISNDVNSQIEWVSIKNLDNIKIYSQTVDNKHYTTTEIDLPDTCTVFIKSDISNFSGFFYKTTFHPASFMSNEQLIEDSYSFPININTAISYTNDITPPKVNLYNNGSHSNLTGTVYDGLQNSSKLAQLYMLEEYSRNFDFEIISADKGFITDSEGNSFVAGLPVQLEFELNKIDEDKDAFAVIYACDRAGNDTLVFINEDKFTSIESKPSLTKYITMSQSNLEVLPQALADGFTELLVFDINGNRLLNSDIASQRNIALSQLASGTYFATLKNGERLVTQKFVVAK